MIHLLLAIFDFNISLLLLIFTKLERFLFKIDSSVTGFDKYISVCNVLTEGSMQTYIFNV